jgi:hypothetical protein
MAGTWLALRVELALRVSVEGYGRYLLSVEG